MAAANGGEGGGDWDMEQQKLVRRLQELFHGRFTDEECKLLLEHQEWRSDAAVVFIFGSSQQDINEVLNDNDWTVVTYVRRNDVLRDLASRNQVPAEFRQFTCRAHSKMWWRKVPGRKPVGRCHVCRKRVDALPRDKEWGWAKFSCRCGREFHAFGAMDVSMLGQRLYGRSKTNCYGCRQNLCEPEEIIPPFKRQKNNDGRRRRDTHRCTAYNCYRKCMPEPGEPIVPVCVHPKSIGTTKILALSKDHVSTGSTVATFLTQDELEEPYGDYEPSLCPVPEDGGGGARGGARGGNGDNC